jgi:diadenosine tetraphosphate (Ap4A) HIT family hydrolase
MCFLCNVPKNVRERVFYEDRNRRWFAFLSAPPHTKGHVILAALRRNGGCPKKFNEETLVGFDVALREVIEAMRKCYTGIKDKHILLASLRGDTPHFHIHILPLWPREYSDWKKVTGYAGSHLMEFLGSLEKKHDFKQLEYKAEKGKRKENAQRRESTNKLTSKIKRLRQFAKYKKPSF